MRFIPQRDQVLPEKYYFYYLTMSCAETPFS